MIDLSRFKMDLTSFFSISLLINNKFLSFRKMIYTHNNTKMKSY